MSCVCASTSLDTSCSLARQAGRFRASTSGVDVDLGSFDMPLEDDFVLQPLSSHSSLAFFQFSESPINAALYAPVSYLGARQLSG